MILALERQFNFIDTFFITLRDVKYAKTDEKGYLGGQNIEKIKFFYNF